MYFNDQENCSTDSELLVNDAVLLGQPVDAVIALPHPTKQNMTKILDGKYISSNKPADGAADGVGGEASGHASSGLVHRGKVDLGGAEDKTKQQQKIIIIKILLN